MATNAISPWIGTLEWVGEPSGGMMKNGKAWKSVEFTVKYQDHQMNDRHITFYAFGEERVDKILNAPLGSSMKVVWWPDSNRTKDGNKWFTKNNVLSLSITPPKQETQQEEILEGDLPFRLSPGVRG